jgi:hypothetical protein
MKSIRIVFPAAVAALVVLLLAIGQFGYRYEFSVFAFPLCLGLFVIVMAIASTVLAWRGRDSEPEVNAHITDAEGQGLLLEPATWVQFGCVLGLMALCWILGFIPGIVIFMFVYLWRFGWKPWFAAVCGLVFGGVVWLLFGLLFVTPLPFWPIFMR